MQYLVREREARVIESLLGAEVFNRAKEIGGVFLCGGALTSIFTNTKVNDFDLYFKSQVSFDLLDSFFRSKYNCVYKTDNANTYEFSLRSKADKIKVQLIKKSKVFNKSIEAVLGVFDFSVCQAGFDFEKSVFVTHDNFIYDLSKRELVFNKDSTAPLNTLIRIKKYLARGFSMSPKEMVRLALVINSLDLTKIEVVKENVAGLGSGELEVVTKKLTSSNEINVEELLQELLDNKIAVPTPEPINMALESAFGDDEIPF